MSRPRRLLRLLTLAAGLVLLAAPAPVAADPAQPTNFRSRVVSVVPPLPAGVRLSVVGGDAFLELQVAPGHSVEVPDYEQGRGQRRAPYLRFRSDGVVQQNDASLAAQVNGGRYGAGADVQVDPGAEPRWRVVARDGRHAWHDHRIHWMLPRPPTAVDARGRVDLGGDDGTWEVPLVVDGEAVTVRGELVVLEAPSPLPWLALAILTALAATGVAIARHRRGRGVPHAGLGAALLVTGVAAVVVAAAAWLGVPPGTGPSPTSTLLAAAGTILAGVTLAALRVGRVAAARAAFAATVAAIGSWAVLRRDVLTNAWLPTTLPFALDRTVTALALGLATGAAVVLVWRPPGDRRVSGDERFTVSASEPMEGRHGADRSGTRAGG